MIIYKLQQEKTNKVYIGYSVNDNPNNFGSGKYIKRAVKDFGTTSFKREVVEVFKKDQSLSDVLKRVEYWINKFKSDNSKYGFNETVQELIPQRKRLTKKLQVLLTPEDEDSLNTIIIQKSMEDRIKPVAISRYVRQLIVEHIVEETKPEKQLIKNK
jgi:protein subunit release factor A|tara:strand:- start:875 stop:1345 length:471 start_codon:yes stop_codon:yes gene_type:complete